MSHSRRGRLDPKKTKRELRRREREVGIRRRIDIGWVLIGLAFVVFVVAFILLYLNA